MTTPQVLALDLASGGVTASLVGKDLRPVSTGNAPWTFIPEGSGAGTLSLGVVLDTVASAVRSGMADHPPPELMVLSSMMHTLAIVSVEGEPLSPVFTWNDRRGGAPVAGMAVRLGNYRERTGCHFHPSFPAYKLAWLRGAGAEWLNGEFRVGSLRSCVQHALTGTWSEDVATASASGLMELDSGKWDRVTLDALRIDPAMLPPLVDCRQIEGRLSRKWAAQLGLPDGCPVVAGAGDGFLAATGSGCDTDRRAAATLGTTASVRRFVTSSATGSDPCTFCYRYGDGRFLSGCAGNNGGNVLEWASHALGPIGDDESSHSPPLFLPFLLGERAPFWDAALRPRWVGVDGSTLSDLRTAVIESQAFQLAVYLELTTRGAAARPKALILSGNGFSHAPIAGKLAALVGMPVLAPIEPGLATIRGAARCGFGAMGEDTHDDVERLVDEATAIESVGTPGLDERYGRFRDLYLDLDSDREPARD